LTQKDHQTRVYFGRLNRLQEVSQVRAATLSLAPAPVQGLVPLGVLALAASLVQAQGLVPLAVLALVPLMVLALAVSPAPVRALIPSVVLVLAASLLQV
jgi:hypothetical protein